MGFIRMFLALVVVVGHFQQQSKAFDIGAVSPFAMLGLNYPTRSPGSKPMTVQLDRKCAPLPTLGTWRKFG